MDEVVTMLGLEDKLKSMPNNLSGGQQQRVAIATKTLVRSLRSALPMNWAISNSKTSADVLGLLQSRQEVNQTLVIITHNNAIAQSLLTAL